MAPDSFDIHLGHCLEPTGNAVIVSTKSLYFRGNPSSLAIQLLGLVPELEHWLPDCQEVSASYELGHGGQ